MAGELEAVVRTMLDAIDGGDPGAAASEVSEDVQGVDEISRRWMRGRSALVQYMEGLAKAVSDVHSEIHEPHEVIWGDAGVLTCWLEQDYTFEGARQHVSAPTTAVMRREGGEWKMVLFHSLPLPEEPS